MKSGDKAKKSGYYKPLYNMWCKPLFLEKGDILPVEKATADKIEWLLIESEDDDHTHYTLEIENGHLVINSKRFSDGFFCITCRVKNILKLN